MILYVAGPMSNLPQHNYPAFFAAEEELRRAGYGVLNPARIDELYSAETGERTWAWYMRRALHMLTDSDAVALLPGWEASRGARLEERLARQLGMDVLTLEEWVGAARARTEYLREATA